MNKRSNNEKKLLILNIFKGLKQSILRGDNPHRSSRRAGFVSQICLTKNRP